MVGVRWFSMYFGVYSLAMFFSLTTKKMFYPLPPFYEFCYREDVTDIYKSDINYRLLHNLEGVIHKTC